MPRMDNAPPASGLVKLLLIGDGKLGKTFYAAMAAKAGLNILYIDGDVGSATINSMIQSGALTKEEASRIYLIDARDTILGGKRDSKMVETLSEFTSSVKFRWNDDESRVARRGDTGNIWEITPSRMGFNDLIIFDSWTAYAESVMLWVGKANGVDVANATLSEMRPVYQGGGLKTTEMLQVIRSLSCHVIVIAHPDEFQHTTAPEGVKVGAAKEKDRIIDWTKMIPKTVSKPQGLQMSKYMTDVAWMELSPAGNERRLNFKPKNDRVGGGHFFDSKSVDEYSFVNLIKQVSGHTPVANDSPAWIDIQFIEAGTPPAQASATVLDGTKSAPINGLAAFMPKGK